MMLSEWNNIITAADTKSMLHVVLEASLRNLQLH